MAFRPTIVVVAVAISPFVQGRTLAQAPGENSAFGVYSSHVKRDRFISDMGWTDEQYYEWSDGQMQTLGAHWTRVSLFLLWSLIEPNLGDPYNWNAPPGTPDTTLRAIYEPPNQIHCLAVITPGMGPTTRNPLQYPNEWQAFVRAAAERYDGDGIDDFDPNISVNYFQLVNEDQDWRNLPFGTAGNYGQTARLTLDALRLANPNAKLALVGTGGRPPFQQFIQDAIDSCIANGVELTAIDLHHWSSSDTFSWKVPNVPTARSFLDSRALSGVEIWSTEHAAWTGCPTGAPVISEEDQARWLIKSFTYNRERGLDKIQWSQLIDWYMFQGNAGSIFNSMGLVGDGWLNCESVDRRGTERIAYWAFQTLASKTDNGVATLSGRVSGVYMEDNLFAYEFVRDADGERFFMVWSETGNQVVALPVPGASYHVTNLITDRDGNVLDEYDVASFGGQLTVTVGGDPVMIEPNALASIPASSQWSVIVMVIALLAGGTVVIRAHAPTSTWSVMGSSTRMSVSEKEKKPADTPLPEVAVSTPSVARTMTPLMSTLAMAAFEERYPVPWVRGVTSAIDRVVRKFARHIGLDHGFSAHSMRATFITTTLDNARG